MPRIISAPSETLQLWLPQAARHLRQGGVLALPTETVYGLACVPEIREAVEALFALKERPADKRLPLQVDSVETAEAAGFSLSAGALRLAGAFWPGALTLILPRPGFLPPWFAPGSATVGLRIPNHPVALALLKEMDRPLAVTSANLSGHPPCMDARETAGCFAGENQLLVLDGGRARGGIASTVVSVEEEGIRVYRQGPLALSDLESALAEPIPGA